MGKFNLLLLIIILNKIICHIPDCEKNMAENTLKSVKKIFTPKWVNEGAGATV